MKKYLFLLLILISCLFVGCQQNSEDETSYYYDVTEVQLTDNQFKTIVQLFLDKQFMDYSYNEALSEINILKRCSDKQYFYSKNRIEIENFFERCSNLPSAPTKKQLLDKLDSTGNILCGFNLINNKNYTKGFIYIQKK